MRSNFGTKITILFASVLIVLAIFTLTYFGISMNNIADNAVNLSETEIADIITGKIITAGIVYALIFVAAIILIIIYLNRTISNPLKYLSTQVKDFGNGNLKIRFKQKTDDSIGQMAGSLKVMTENLRDTIGKIKETGENLS
ncbi:MAG TPA: HAMP domain-containing protein, partial [Tepiditoga sp.]|nr:HAMP domain-containing protein [Tepiditoga sp.]